MAVVIFGNKSLPVHEAFHRSRARERVAFGAVGSGKTYALMDEAIALALQFPGIRGMLTRKTVPELRDTTEPAFRERMPIDLWNSCTITKTGGHLDRCIFPNGSTVYFRSMDDWRKHKSFNLGFIGWDELSEFTEEDYIGMTMHRLRQKEPTAEARALGYTAPIPTQFSFAATNPEGKNWCWRLFHPDSPERRKSVEAFFSTTLDNPYLGPEYVENLLTMPDIYIKRFVLCQFDDFAGRIYEEFNWDDHTVEHPNWRELQIERPLVWMSVDPGTENPTAGLWCWMDVENRTLVGIAEYEQPGLAVDQHAAAWRGIEARQRMQVRWRVGDPNSITQRDRGSAIQLATQYAKQGFNFSLGASSHNDRIPALAHLIHLRRFKLSRQACPKTYESIKNYQWKDLTPQQRVTGESPKQEPLKKNDHLVNCAEYLAGRESPLKPLHKRNVPKDMHEEIHQAIRKQLRRKRLGRYLIRHDLGGVV